MTFDDITRASPGFGRRWAVLAWLRAWRLRRQTRLQIDRLDDRQRRDIGLEPRGWEPLTAADAATRIVMMTGR